LDKIKWNHKDSVFTMLFGDNEGAIELFNALNGTDYPMDTEVIFTTLDDVLYNGKENDIGFIIDNQHIVLTEHQSTINENMPLRQLQYIGRTYEKVVNSTSLFGKKQVKIPMPEFYVLYTGSEKWDKEYLKLSDAFLGCDRVDNSMELVVKLINLGYNEENEVLNRSNKLKGYSLLLKYIKDNAAAGYDKGEAIHLAVRRCLEEGILKDFLKTHSSEVGSMLYNDISIEEFIELRAQEAAEDIAKDMAENMAKDMAENMAKDMAKKLKEKGMPYNDICDCTGLSKEIIESL